MYTTLRNLKERRDMLFVRCEGEDLFCETQAQFYPQKRIDKIEHEEKGTSARTEICQDAEKADQKVK